MAANESDVVASLLASPFSRRSFSEKMDIIKKGRPTPQLRLNETSKTVERHFKTENYERYTWMTGCQKTNRLFCWSCVLFSTDRSSTWALALMSIEKGLLLELKSKDKLYDAAIAHFTKKDQRMDFVFI